MNNNLKLIPMIGLVCLASFAAMAQTNSTPAEILLASVINSEASGESYQEKLRVGNVVLNRVRSKYYPNNIHDVIFQYKQFSGVCGKLFRYIPNGDRGDVESIRAARALLCGERVLEPTIIGFFNESLATNKKFVRRIKNKVVFKSEAHSYFRG